MKINIYQCWLKKLWRSVWSNTGITIDGHTYQDIEYYKNCDVIIGKCLMCGKMEISWQNGYEVTESEMHNY